MQNNLLQLVNEASTANRSIFRAFEDFNENNAQTCEKLINVQLDLASIFIEGSAQQLKLWSAARNYRDVLAAQSRLTEEYGSRTVKNVRAQVAILAGARDAYTAWIEQGVDHASENLKRTTDHANRRAA